jgi:hypothetical protein
MKNFDVSVYVYYMYGASLESRPFVKKAFLMEIVAN